MKETFRQRLMHGVQRVWIAYDRDEAGDKAALSLAEELMAMRIECFRVLFPHGMDANEHARKTKPAARVLEIVGVKLDSGREVSFNLKENRHLDYGYAVTSHSSQGATADRVLVNVDTEEAHANLINSRLAYVAVSRARYDAQIYTNDAGNLGKALSREVSHAAAVNGQQEENALVSGETGATGYGENSAANHSQASQHDQGHDMAMEA